MEFDEYMNLDLYDAKEVHIKCKTGRTLGQILLEGDNIDTVSDTMETGPIRE